MSDTPILTLPVLTEAALTTRQVGGAGLFDGIMETMAKHLRVEYDKGRISGEDYAKAWISSMEAALGASVQFALQKDQAYYQALLVQKQVEKIDFEIKELLPKSLEKATKEIESISSEISLSTARRDQILYETANIQPLQKAGLEHDNAIKAFQLSDHLPAQVAGITADTAGKIYNNDFLLPAQLVSLKEQNEAHRAKTLDTRTDGAPVKGAIGVQIALQKQQIDSFKRDAETKVAKMILDTWITQKSMDEGLAPPSSLTDVNINSVMAKLRTNLEL